MPARRPERNASFSHGPDRLGQFARFEALSGYAGLVVLVRSHREQPLVCVQACRAQHNNAVVLAR